MHLHLGIFAKMFPRPTLEQTLGAVVAHGLSHVQFNLSCVGLPTVPDRVDPSLCDRIKSAFRAQRLTMAAISGTFNMIDPDETRRRAGLLAIQRLADICELLGTSVITLCTGSRDPHDMWRWDPQNSTRTAWMDLLQSMQSLLEVTEPTRVTLAFEPELGNVVHSAARARELLDHFQSPRLKVVIDPANLFPTGSLPRMRDIIDEAFHLLGNDIVLAHAKDLTHDGEAGHAAAGKGILDYSHYLGWLRRIGYDGALILHGLPEEEVASSVSFLRERIECCM
jgi:sugar phosphate isomerase/epimerase